MTTERVRPEGAGAGTPLFTWVKQSLQESIARGEFLPDQPFVTQREIVERFGVSTTTAVRALNELVAEGAVVRIRGRGTFVADPGPPAPPPSGGQRVVAYVSPDGEGPHMAQLLAGLAAEAAAVGYRLTVAHTAGVAGEEAVLRRVADEGARAIVFFPRDGSTAAATLEDLRRRGVAVVVVDRYLPGLPTDAVLFDDFAIGYGVTAAMLDRGHRALAVLWRETEVTSVRDRLSGHYRALRDRDLPELPERSALRVYDSLDPAVRRQRLQTLLTSGDGLTALICGNALTLALAVTDLLTLDCGFPGSVELASMDEAGPYDVSPLAVASARLPSREMGRAAVRLVHERLEGSTEPARHVVLDARVRTAERRQNILGVIGARASPAPSVVPPAETVSPGRGAGTPASP